MDSYEEKENMSFLRLLYQNEYHVPFDLPFLHANLVIDIVIKFANTLDEITK